MASYCYAAVTNIPSNFHTADLRAYFSSLVEGKCFVCFHFRHRPEKSTAAPEEPSKSEDAKRCCIVQVMETKMKLLLDYDDEHWTDVEGRYYPDVCHVSKIKLKLVDGLENNPEEIEEEKLLEMPELRPPELMPNGNVGTPTAIFLDLIQRCLLPYNLISKLHLKFPKTTAKRIYGNVNFNYGTAEGDSDEAWLNISRTKQAKPSASISLDVRQYGKHKQSTQAEENTRTSGGSPISPTDRNQQGSSTNDLVNDVPESHFVSEKSVHGVPQVLSTHLRDGQNTPMEDLERQIPVSEEEGKTHISLTVTSTSDRTTMEHVGETVCANTLELKVSESASVCDEPARFLVPEPARRDSRASKRLSHREKKKLAKEDRRLTKKLMAEQIEENLIAVEKRYHDDEDAEEWDRHEASEDDPSNQERNKERLYEEEIEQPWEKGGPGVLFYTDAMYWQEKEGDFDEQTTDDLDVDFSAYEEPGAGDKDIKDFLKIRQEKRFRRGYDSTDRFSVGIGKKLPGRPAQSGFQTLDSNHSRRHGQIGAFERYSKGIGRKVMEKQGWKEGQGLGSSRPGITQALWAEGQKANNKKGLGFVEEKPVVYRLPHMKKSQAQRHHITTVYDNPQETDPKEPLLERSEPTTLKHRQSHLDHFS